MKKHIVILGFLIFISCNKDCILNYEIVDTRFSIPYITGQNEIIRQFDKTDYDRYELVNVYESEIPYIMHIIKSQIVLNKKASEKMKNKICNYGVQIAGFYDRYDKTKKIYLNFHYFMNFHESEDEILIGYDGKETKFEIPSDGGDSFFKQL